MKKSLIFILLLICAISTPEIESASKVSPDVKVLCKMAQKSENKLPLTSWSFKIEADNFLFEQPLIEIDEHSKSDAEKRFNRMLHTFYLKEKVSPEMIERAYSISKYIPQIISYVKNEMAISGKIQHISIYGSFLYNMVDPDDIDILLIVDSANSIFSHSNVNSKLITGVKGLFPKLSLQIIDYNSYQIAVSHCDLPHLSRADNLALQQIVMGSAWYYTIYGFDLRYDDPNSLKKNTKVNYLNKSIKSLKNAGDRLYKSIYATLPYESERIRLRKVVSRILITDFLIPILDKSRKGSFNTIEKLYSDIRATPDNERKKWKEIEKRTEALYFQKLEELLSIAEKQGKLHEINFTSK